MVHVDQCTAYYWILQNLKCVINQTLSYLLAYLGRAIAEAVSRWLPTAAARVRARVWSCGIVVDKVALGQVFSEYFGFPCQSSFHQLLHNHPHISSGACTIGQKWPQYLVDIVPLH
jgi:hypothetical protein